MTNFYELILGHKNFSASFKDYESRFKELAKNGQDPNILFITCSDSRVDPSLITKAKPGSLFIVRNIGNFVAPYSPDEDFHSTAAAIEYAVSVLNVTDIIICGHSDCGAIKSLYDIPKTKDLIHVKKWLELGQEAKNYVEKNYPNLRENKMEILEKTSILFQMNNLLTYPSVKKSMEENNISIHGWYFKIKTGSIEYYDKKTSTFKPIVKQI